MRERREDLDAVETDGLDALGEDFVDELAGLHDDFGRIERVRDVFGRAAAHDAFGEGDEELVAVVDRGLPDAVRDVHVDAVDAGVAELGHQLFRERGFGLREELGGAGRVRDVGGQVTAEGGVAERDDFRTGGHVAGIRDDDIHGHVAELTGHVAGVGGLERGVGQALTGAVRRDEVLEDREAFAEGGQDRTFDDLTGGLGHQAAGAAELLHLRLVTTRAGVHEDVHRVDEHAVGVAGIALLHAGHLRGLRERGVHRLRDGVGGAGPGVDDLVTTFVVGDRAGLVLALEFADLGGGFADEAFLLLRVDHVVHADGDAGLGRDAEAGLLERVEDRDRSLAAAILVGLQDQVAELALLHGLVEEAEFGRPDGVEDDAADRGDDRAAVGVAMDRLTVEVGVGVADPVMQVERAFGFGERRLGHGAQHRQVGVGRRLVGGFERQVVGAEHDVLGRREDRLTAGRREDVVRGHHQELALHDGFQGQRDVDGHLVTVEVRVVSGTDERVEADRVTLDEDGLEGLDGQTVERRRAVEEHRVTLGHFLQDIPDLGLLLLDVLAGAADGVGEAQFLEAADDERLEEDEGHLLRETALVELELGTDDDDGTAGVVDALAEEVLAETAMLALQHVRDGLQLTVAVLDRLAVAAVVEEGVDGFLEHAHLIVDDDVGRLHLDELLQAVVAVDDATVEVVQVGGGETAAFEGDERTEVRRDDREHRQDHVLGTLAGSQEALDDLHAAGDLLLDLLGARGAELVAEVLDRGGEIHLLEELLEGFGAHAGLEGVGAVLFDGAAVGFLVEELLLFHAGGARVDDQVLLVVDDLLELAGGHVEHQRKTAGHALQEPDVGDRDGEADVAHALATDAGHGDFDAALVADDVLVLHLLVLAAVAFVVADRAEDALAEEAVRLGLERAVVDGLRALYFLEALDLAVAVFVEFVEELLAGPLDDLLGGGDRDGDEIEGLFLRLVGGELGGVLRVNHVC